MSLSCSPSFASPALESLLPGVMDGDALASVGLVEAAGDAMVLAAFFNSSSLRFLRSCLARSSGLVVLVNTIDFPSGDQTGLPAPLGKSVNVNASPPVSGSMHNCAGSGLPSFSVARRNTRNLPSGDQRGEASCSPFVN